MADRAGADLDRDVYPRLVVRAADAVVQSVIELYASKQVPRSDLAHLTEPDSTSSVMGSRSVTAPRIAGTRRDCHDRAFPKRRVRRLRPPSR